MNWINEPSTNEINVNDSMSSMSFCFCANLLPCFWELCNHYDCGKND